MINELSVVFFKGFNDFLDMDNITQRNILVTYALKAAKWSPVLSNTYRHSELKSSCKEYFNG